MDKPSMGQLRLAVNTQTPLVRFLEGSVKPTTGGVVRMLLPLLRRWQRDGTVRSAEWVAMGDIHEKQLELDGVLLSFVALSDDEKRGYATVKERMWELLNSNPSIGVPHGEGGIPEDAWLAYEGYQARSAEALRQASERMGGVDLLYVHDFQQLGVAQRWKGAPVPKVFHLHTPFPSVLPGGWAELFVSELRRYDAVIVSTERYAENLRAAGLDTPVNVIHPFIDPAEFRDATPREVAGFRERFGIASSDRVILNVGRMDPMKGQDRLVTAMPAILAAQPEARLVLVGNGSFSSARNGGLGLDKGREWRAHLEALARELKVESRVTFTGHLGDDDIPAAYAASEVFSLPSTREGFGLAAIEAWRYRKPVVVSDRAGVSELVVGGVNGASVDCSDPSLLAEAILAMLRDPDGAAAMGREGRTTSEAATLDAGEAALQRVFAGALEERAYAVA